MLKNMCNNTSISFKWLDILEKEFDKAFVSIELLLGDFDSEDGEMLHVLRKKLATMCSCFSQLSHKALTIFQMNCKAEAEVVNLKSELLEMSIHNQLLEKEVHSLLIQLHADQLERLNLSDYEQKENIKDKLQRDLATCSPIRASFTELETNILKLGNWKRRLQVENELLRSTVVSLQAEVCGARLAARYLDKELAGRMQQLQLLTRDDMNVEVKNKLWDQLDAEILLQRHKTVIKVMRQQKNHKDPPDNITGQVRNVYLNREPSKGLGISVTGGKEHGVPILISDLEPVLMSKNLFVGDAILSVNGIDLNQFTHKEAVKVLSNQLGNITLTVITLSTINISEIEEEANVPSYLSYPFFDETDLGYARSRVPNTPTAPRTPPSYCTDSVRSSIESVKSSSPEKQVDSSIQENNSETELYGITTLQNIFRSVSAIESSQKNNNCSAHISQPAIVVHNSSSSSNARKCDNNSYNEDIRPHNGLSNAATRPSITGNHVENVKPITAIIHSSVPSDRIIHSSVVGSFGDSSIGTPV